MHSKIPTDTQQTSQLPSNMVFRDEMNPRNIKREQIDLASLPADLRVKAEALVAPMLKSVLTRRQAMASAPNKDARKEAQNSVKQVSILCPDLTFLPPQHCTQSPASGPRNSSLLTSLPSSSTRTHADTHTHQHQHRPCNHFVRASPISFPSRLGTC